MSPQDLRDLVDRCLTHVRCAQAPLRVERADREPGAPRREVCAALLDLSDAEDRLVRAAPGGDGWALLLAEVRSLCARAREWTTKGAALEGKSIRTNLDAVIELLRLYGSADPAVGATPITTTEEGRPARRLSKHEQLDLLRLLEAGVRGLQRRPIADYLRDHFAAEDSELAELATAAEGVLRGGEHDGPCTNQDEHPVVRGACELHVETARARKERLRMALDQVTLSHAGSDRTRRPSVQPPKGV